jgi:hypothetical protein
MQTRLRLRRPFLIDPAAELVATLSMPRDGKNTCYIGS